MIDVRIISIGAMAAHPLWGERNPVRTGHATTTLIRSGKRAILIDPGLPEQALVARLGERAGLAPTDVTHVLLTSFRPETMRALTAENSAFQNATWWVSETERETLGVPLAFRLRDAAQEGDGELVAILEREVAILHRCKAAPDNLAPRVDLFPLPGVTPGLCGVIVAGPASGIGTGTAVICGDAIPTIEHLERGQAPQGAVDVERARESFREVVEIADMLILGRDGMVVNPVRRAAWMPGAGREEDE